MSCIFCVIPKQRIILINKYAYAIMDGFPITPLHTLIIPKRHIADYFDLSKDELLGCYAMLKEIKKNIQSKDLTIGGFNIGINSGISAGQTILHCHIHLIPRRTGDVDNPRGGIRHMIPEKGFY